MNVRFSFPSAGQWSGGGRALLSNIEYAAQLSPRIDNGGHGVPVICRNFPHRHIASSYAILPHNAWVWRGPKRGLAEKIKLTGMRAATEVAISRSEYLIRIGDSIPRRGACNQIPLHNVLDVGYEKAIELIDEVPRRMRDAIVSIGSFNTYRDFETLINSFILYRKRGGNRPLVVAGPSTSRSYVQRVRSLADGRDDITVLPGGLRREEALSLISAARMCVLPSRVETSPLTALEVMSLCPTLIASDIPGHRGIVGSECDLVAYFPPGSVQALASKLLDADSIAPAESKSSLQYKEGRDLRRYEWALGLDRILGEAGEHFVGRRDDVS